MTTVLPELVNGQILPQPLNQAHALPVKAQRINKLAQTWAPQPRTASPAPTAANLSLCSSLASPTIVQQACDLPFSVHPLVAPTPALLPTLQGSKFRGSPASRPRQAFARMLLPPRREGPRGQNSKRTRVAGREVTRFCARVPKHSRRGCGEHHIPHFSWTRRPTPRARVPRGARAALGEPEASQGEPSLEATSFHPIPELGDEPCSLLRGTAADYSLWAGADDCLSAPHQPATQPLRPHPGADSPETYPDSPDLAFPRVPRPHPGVGSASASEIYLVHGAGRSLRATWAHGRWEAAARKGVQIQREPGCPLLTLSSPPCFPPRRRRKFPSTHL